MKDATKMFSYSQLSQEFSQTTQFDVPGGFSVLVSVILPSVENREAGALKHLLEGVRGAIVNLKCSNSTEVVQSVKDRLLEALPTIEVTILCRTGRELTAYHNGMGQVGLVRHNQLGKIYSSNHSGSVIKGSLEANDLVIIGNQSFWDTFHRENLVGFVEHRDTEASVDKAELLHTRLHGYFQDQENQVCYTILALNQRTHQPTSMIKPIKERLLQIVKPPSFSHHWRARQKLAVLLFFVLAFVLFLSVKAGAQKRRLLIREKAFSELESLVAEKSQVALSQQNTNRAAAVTALTGAIQQIEAKGGQFPPGSKEALLLIGLKNKIVELYASLSLETKVQPSLFLDLSLISPNFLGQGLSRSDQTVLVYNKSSGVGITFDTETKKAALLPANLGSVTQVTMTEDFVFTLKGSVLETTALGSGTQKTVATVEASTSADLVASFGTNVYLLDKPQGSILRYRPVDSGAYVGKPWLAPGITPDFSQVRDLCIDGTIWVLNSDGSIRRYTGGVGDQIEILGMVQPFKLARFVDVDDEFVYIWDEELHRVVVASHKGEYKAQFGLNNFDQKIIDFVVHNHKGFFLTDEQIWVINLTML